MLSRIPGGDVQRTTMSAAMLFAQPWRVPPEFFTEQHDLGRRPGQLEASTAMARALFDVTGQREVLLDQLRTLTMPTLVIWGENDYVLPAHHARAAVDRLPGGRLSLFPDCGHLPHVEHPDRFAAVLSDWLTEHHDSSASKASTRRITTEPATWQPSATRPTAPNRSAPLPTGRKQVGGLPQPGRPLRPADRTIPALA